MKKVYISFFLIFLIIFSLNIYVGNLKKETIHLCEMFSENSTGNGFNLKDAILIAKNKGFDVSTTSDHGKQALFYKLSTFSGLCIGTHKNGMLYNVKYHSHT